MKALFLWQPNPNLLKHLRHEVSSSVEFIIPDSFEEAELLKHATDIDLVIGWRPTLKLITKAKKLKLVVNPGAGVNQLTEILPLLPKQITLVNGHGNAYYTAQHTVGLLLALMNKIVIHHQYMLQGKWRTADKEAKSIALRNKTVGLLGYGHINKRIHQFLKGFEVEFHALKTNWIEAPADLTTYTDKELPKFLEAVDILIVGLPLTKQTKGLLGKKELKLLGANGLLINIGRGEIIHESALYNALKNNEILGAAIDVWYDYDPKPDAEGRKFPSQFPFDKLENVVLSPHRAASPFDDPARWVDVIYNINELASGRLQFINVVNIDRGY